MRDLDELFDALGRSPFRSRFCLGRADRAYLERKGLETVLEHARQFIAQRLAAAEPRNDGRQTPMRGHPVFVAQHATGTCCRSCLAKWHGIPAGIPIDQGAIEYIVRVLNRWIELQVAQQGKPTEGFQRRGVERSRPLFGFGQEEVH